MKRLVMRIFQRDVLQPFIFLDESISDNLHFRLMWDGLQIRIQDGWFGIGGFPVPVGLGVRVEAAGQFGLEFWCEGCR